MKDDIRASEKTKTTKQNSGLSNQQDNIEPPEEVIKSFARLDVKKREEPETFQDNGEGGFVVLPGKKDDEKPEQPKLAQPPTQEPITPKLTNHNEKRSGKNPFKKFAGWFKGLSKVKKIIFVGVLALVLIASSIGVYALTRSDPPPAPEPAPVVEKKVEPPKPTTEASKLTGAQVPIGTNKKPVISVQIENSPDARPQSSLHQAGVVFEAIAEGGITRFNASFLDNEPDYIGPIRSVRPYYAVLAAPFDPVFVHAGGSGAGLAKLAELGLKDMDHGANGATFERVSDRYAPHNLYTSYAKLAEANKSRGYTSSDTKSFTRKPEKALTTPQASKIDLQISSPLYNVSYNYDKKSNSYLRNMAGVPHKDQRSGKQISPKVVIALATDYGIDGIYSVYRLTGTGSAYIFQNGGVKQVTWTKKTEKDQFVFTDETGKEFGINPGQTWVTLLKSLGDATYTP